MLQELTKRIARAKIGKIILLIVSLDIKNAFITIEPKIITNKIEQYKCPRNFIKIPDSVLRKREIVYEDGNVRVIEHLAAGSPQVSPLSPLY